jgi:hypothetical protein
MRNSRTATWLAQLLAGFALIGGGLQVAWTFWPTSTSVAAGSLGAAALGLALVVWAESRERSRRLLRGAQRSLQLPKEWSVEFERPLPEGGGTVPIVVTRSDRACFVVGVRPWRQVSLRKEITGREQALLGPRGKELAAAELADLAHAAAALGAQPVLWLPQAREPRSLRHAVANLIVVMGSARHLKHALLGAETAGPRVAPPEPAAPRPAPPRRDKAAPATAQKTPALSRSR